MASTASRWSNAPNKEPINLANQLAELLWFSDALTNENNINLVATSYETLNTQVNKKSFYTILNINQGVPENEQTGIPFPSFAIRKKSTNEALQFAAKMYNVDFVIDVAPTANMAFYGVSFGDKAPTLTPYFKKDSLLIALQKYDQVWWLSSKENAISTITGGKKVNKKVKILINKLVKKVKERKRIIKNNNWLAPTDVSDYTRWAWQQYSAGISLLNNPADLPIKTLDTATFATIAMGNYDFSLFNRHLDFYTQIDLLPRDLIDNPTNISGYSYLFVPAQNLSASDIEHLNKISQYTEVILAWFSPYPPPKELSAAITQLHIPQLNGVTQALVPQLIFGALGFKANKSNISYAPPTLATLPLGRLQFGPPELAFMDASTLEKIDALVKNSIKQKATPGSQVLVAKNGIVVYYQNFGSKTYQNTDAIKDRYLYDLASLTKVMATTQAIMFLAERGMLDLDMPIAHYLPEMWGTDKEFIPVREILAHQAGLYPYIPFWKKVLPKRDLANALTHKKSKDAFQIGQNTYIAPYLKDSLLSWSIHSKRLRKSTNEQAYGYKYSDIGFIILKTLVERIVNQPLDEFLDQNLYAPLGMNHTTFNPLHKFSAKNIVPTEGNGMFRVGELTGFVNDQNAALIGGVSGHAGLFSNALDLAKLMQLQLQLGSYGGTTYLYPETILNFTKRQYVGNRRGLGWDKPSRGSNGPTTDLASQKTFGHTGFTGTAAWADPEHQLIFIFLSNRVYPDPGNFKLIQLNVRTRIQSLLYETIDFNN